ncbi:hypothetical protein [Legionella sp. km535]|uniref:hypothetical protein n=1 Tax=Legionella sp. km535 TaxID=2498107 RepID=UPI0013150ACC|nr:hypothetical protein [Legionella sp. km535]
MNSQKAPGFIGALMKYNLPVPPTGEESRGGNCNRTLGSSLNKKYKKLFVLILSAL